MSQPANGEPSNRSGEAGEETRKPFTEFAYALMCLAMSILLFWAPWYLNLESVVGRIAGLILSIVFYAAATVFLIMVMSFLNAATTAYPQLKGIIPSLGTNKTGWEATYGTATFLAIASSIHFVVMGIFDAGGLIAVIAKVVVLVFLLFAATQAATAVDAFAVRPLLERASREDEESKQMAAEGLRKVGTAIAGLIAFLSALAALIDVIFLK